MQNKQQLQSSLSRMISGAALLALATATVLSLPVVLIQSAQAQTFLSPLGTQVAASEIDACKYLVVTDFASDPFGIAGQLRTQARAKGLTVVSTLNEVAPAERLKVCVMTGSWQAAGFGGSVAVRVLDASGALIGEVSVTGTDWWGVSRTVRKAVAKIYKELGYTGFDEAVYEQRIAREYPKRPTVAITEDEIKKEQPRSVLGGIWTDEENKYRLGIVPAPRGSGADFVAVVLQSNSPLWHPTEIKAEFRTTASPEVFTCTYFMGNKKPEGTTLTLEHDAVLRGSIATQKAVPLSWSCFGHGPARRSSPQKQPQKRAPSPVQDSS